MYNERNFLALFIDLYSYNCTDIYQYITSYFHVKLNIRKRQNSSYYDEFETDVTKLHYSTTEEVYNQRLAIFRKKYINQKETMDYMNKVWLDSDFNKWQIFHNDPGYANEILFVGRPKLIICNPKLIICRPKLIM